MSLKEASLMISSDVIHFSASLGGKYCFMLQIIAKYDNVHQSRFGPGFLGLIQGLNFVILI